MFFILQFQWKCCGVNSSSDWRDFKPDGNSVPESCCVNVTANCGNGAMTNPVKVYLKVNLEIENQKYNWCSCLQHTSTNSSPIMHEQVFDFE